MFSNPFLSKIVLFMR